MKAGVIGATGYAGQQLVGLLNNHPEVEIEYLCSHSFEGTEFSKVYGYFEKDVDMVCIGLEEALEKAPNLDVLFLALPHGKSTEIVNQLKDTGVKIIDFGGDFRMNNVETVKTWYDIEHQDGDFLKQVVYGLPEINKSSIAKAKIVANPGCYPTASILGLLPIIDAPFINKKSIIIDAKSGITGAGRKATLANSYCENNENFKAYSVAAHRHTPEIEEVLSEQAGEAIVLTFTPHLVPMHRGILATIYCQVTEAINPEAVLSLYQNFYKEAPFVRVTEGLPETKKVSRTNYCDISIKYDVRTGKLIVITAIDNLIKGAAGQAVQNMNLMMGYPETMGLTANNYYL
ncbi:MAG: N-acetyl-gamma-glutamyl-phosphate reductase [Clostridia bacterium]|nr:N-acetyl-gamma-glutamyl-phosphate reductase [Clostridia bacterium]